MPYQLETERLILRPLGAGDAQAMFELNADPEVLRYTGDDPFDSVDATAQFLVDYAKGQYALYGVGRMAIELKDSGEVVGWCGLKFHADTGETDLGYRLKRDFWGKGIATEASLAHLHYAIQALGLTRIIARAMRENKASIRVMEKCGFVFERETSDCMDENGLEGVQYVFLKGDSE